MGPIPEGNRSAHRLGKSDLETETSIRPSSSVAQFSNCTKPEPRRVLATKIGGIDGLNGDGLRKAPLAQQSAQVMFW